MYKIFLIVTLLASAASARYTQGYTKSNGTYVNGYHSTDSNNTVNDNYSTQGNTNPYTGKAGTKPYDYGNGR